MIASFADDDTEALFEGREGHRRWQSFRRVARRKLLMLDAAVTLHDLASPPNNRLEALKGDRLGQHSIRVDDQYRVCFVLTEGGAERVEIVDYH